MPRLAPCRLSSEMSHSSIHEERMRRFMQAGLYVVTSQALSAGRSTIAIIEAALRGGAKLIQLREKDMNTKEFVQLAQVARRMTEKADALLVINDRLDVAMGVGADGVHLGQDDFPVDMARRLAPEMIIGASSHSEKEAVEAERLGASYVNIGPLFPTTTKNWRGSFLGLEALRTICPRLRIPVTVMGGIKKEHVKPLTEAGATAIAVVTAVTTAPDPEAAVRELLDQIRKIPRVGVFGM